jgi:hypothetical protein
MPTKEHLLKVIKHLRNLSTGKAEPLNPQSGICAELSCIDYYIKQDVLITAFTSWEHFSGNLKFPVPHHNYTSKGAYHSTIRNWANNRYGMARRALCAHVAEYLEQHLDTLTRE